MRGLVVAAVALAAVALDSGEREQGNLRASDGSVADAAANWAAWDYMIVSYGNNGDAWRWWNQVLQSPLGFTPGSGSAAEKAFLKRLPKYSSGDKLTKLQDAVVSRLNSLGCLAFYELPNAYYKKYYTSATAKSTDTDKQRQFFVSECKTALKSECNVVVDGETVMDPPCVHACNAIGGLFVQYAGAFLTRWVTEHEEERRSRTFVPYVGKLLAGAMTKHDKPGKFQPAPPRPATPDEARGVTLCAKSQTFTVGGVEKKFECTGPYWDTCSVSPDDDAKKNVKTNAKDEEQTTSLATKYRKRVTGVFNNNKKNE